MDTTWYEIDGSAFDRLPRKVRDAIRDYPLNVDCRALRRVAKTESEMLRLIAERKAPSCSPDS